MKPERIQFFWESQWDSSSPFIHKRFPCESFDDAAHCASHVHRVAAGYTKSKVETFIDGDNLVTVKITPTQSQMLTGAQYDLGQWIDESLSYLLENSGDETDDDDLAQEAMN